MKKGIFILTAIIIVIGVLILLPELSQAQAPPPPPGKPSQTPIDGGLGVLAVAGGAYAIKRLRDKKK
ncbi:PID-CTERM protein-sorting domain-containing protein [Rhodohalobacter sp. 614A]|uniref:PID-CTERM protein-sorting domain-containing protein n=1 Tax=Rhodohalobacter sp. 614A TaxID=2908649 RepID=UPI001F18A0A4|nr:hypothetical protein [Rhodohalobacter sp. 614A]